MPRARQPPGRRCHGVMTRGSPREAQLALDHRTPAHATRFYAACGAAESALALSSRSASHEREWPGEQEPLSEQTADLAQRVELSGALDPLGDHVHPERRAELDSGAHNRDPLARRQRGNQCPVELDDVEREPLEAAQRRVAGAEVVKRELNAKPAQLRDDRLGTGVEHETLGDLEHEASRRDPVADAAGAGLRAPVPGGSAPARGLPRS